MSKILYKYSAIETKMMLSIRSKIPPCPGIRLLKSLISTFRLNIDATRSPMTENVMMIAIVFTESDVSQNFWMRIPTQNADMIPPKRPAKVLFGLIFGHILGPPMIFPVMYANESVEMMIARTKMNSKFEFSAMQ